MTAKKAVKKMEHMRYNLLRIDTALCANEISNHLSAARWSIDQAIIATHHLIQMAERPQKKRKTT